MTGAGSGVRRRDPAGVVVVAVVAVLAVLLSVVSVIWPARFSTPSTQRQPGSDQSRPIGDLPFTAVANGLGPVARDRANGGADVDDGGPLDLGGVVWQRGIGVYAPSRIRLYPSGTCARFVADVGVDASAGSAASVGFQVLRDGAEIYDSGTLMASDAPRAIDVDVTGATVLDLVVTDAGDGNRGDAADWADSALLCLS